MNVIIARAVPVVGVKSHFSALLAAVEIGEEITITYHGRGRLPRWYKWLQTGLKVEN